MHWTITGVKPVTSYLKLFWSMCMVSRREISFSRILCMGPCSSVSWRKLWHCFISNFSMSFYIADFLKENFSMHVGHKWVIAMWVTSGLLCGSTGVTHFQPCYSYAMSYIMPEFYVTTCGNYSYILYQTIPCMASLPICDTLMDLPLSRESHDCKHSSCMGKEHTVSNDNEV